MTDILCAEFVATTPASRTNGYYGTFVNTLSELHHAVKGEVYAIDSRTIFIKGFTYDGQGKKC